MMLQRTFDIERLNGIFNDPSVRPHIGGDGESFIDLAAAVEDRANVFLSAEHGAFAFTWSAPGVFEVHTAVLPEGRGAWAAEFADTAREAMADMWGATHLWTRVPQDAENVRRFTLAAGLKPAGQHTLNLPSGAVEYDLYDWRPECPQR